jgi:hypothetical protein
MNGAAGKRRCWKWVAVAAAAAGLGWIFSWPENRGEPAPKEVAVPNQPENRESASGSRLGRIEPAPDELSRARSDAATRRSMEADWEELLEWLKADPVPDPEAIHVRLMELRSEWAVMDPHVLAEFLSVLLASGVDFATGMDFKVGPHGMLDGWPTLRVFLLDVLATSDPEMAAATARAVLAVTGSAEEYATALRSLTRWGAGRAEDGELLGHFDRMLGRDEWQARSGLVEGLDLARWIGSPEAALRLAGWDGHPAVKEMALGEFAADHPAAMMRVLAEGGAVVEGLDGRSRAQLAARADVSDPAQRAAVEAYLRDPSMTAAEAAAFFEVFPLRSATTGFRLYGKTPAPYHHEGIAAGDLAALEMAERWAADPSFAGQSAEIQALRGRLAEWVRQAREAE